MHACSELVNGEEFYKELISSDTGSVSLTQLCEINTQDLDPCPSKIRVPLHCPGCFILNPYQISPLFPGVRPKVSENIAGKGEIACFLLCTDKSCNLTKCKVVCKRFQIGPMPIFSCLVNT